MVHSRAAGQIWRDKRKAGIWSQPRTWVPMTQADLQQLANDVLKEFGLIAEVDELSGSERNG